MKKRISVLAFVTASALGLLSVPVAAGPPDHAPAHGKDCGFGQTHSEKAQNGELGNGGHKPGHHQGATSCSMH